MWRPTRSSPRAVDPSALRSAQNVFTAQIGRSFSVDLGDLATEAWSLLPTTSDFLAEIPTRRFGTLTYAHSTSQPEDITLFNRDQRHNLSIYASKTRLAVQGPFYNEDDEMDYDVLDYNVDVQFSPERLWLEGHGRVKLRIRAYTLGAITLRLAGPLQVRSVVSDTFGRLLPLRVRNQETLVVNLPTPLNRGAEITLTITYRRAARRTTRRSRGDWRRTGPAARGGRPAAGAELDLQQPDVLVPTGDFQRLRHGAGSDVAAARLRCGVHGRSGRRISVNHPDRERRAAHGLCVCGDATRPLSRLSGLAIRRRRESGHFARQRRAVGAGCARSAPLRDGEAPLDDQRAPAPADPRDARAYCRHHLVLFRPAARRAVPVVHTRRRRERAPGGTQPRVLRRAADAIAWQPLRVARRSRVVRELSGVFSGARSGASVVGPRSGLAQLSRAVAERGLRCSTSPRCTRNICADQRSLAGSSEP